MPRQSARVKVEREASSASAHRAEHQLQSRSVRGTALMRTSTGKGAGEDDDFLTGEDGHSSEDGCGANWVGHRGGITLLPPEILATIFNHLKHLPPRPPPRPSRGGAATRLQHYYYSGRMTLALHIPLVCRRFAAVCKARITTTLVSPSKWSTKGAISDVGLVALATARFKAISKLTVNYTTNLDDPQGVLKKMALSAAHARNALKELDLEPLLFNPADCSQIICSFQSLTRLSLACSHITDSELAKIGFGCKQLQYLDINTCSNITDAGLSDVAASCPQLGYLDVSFNDALTDASLEQIAAHCPLLRRLLLSACYNIGDKGLRSLADGSCAALERVALTFGTNCTDAGVAALIRGCPQLDPFGGVATAQEVNAGEVFEIKGDATMRAVAETRPDTTSVCIRGSDSLTGLGVAALAAGCKHVTSLTIQDCEKLTDADFAAAVLGFPLVPFDALAVGYSEAWFEAGGFDVRGDGYLVALSSLHGATISSTKAAELYHFIENLTDVGYSHFIRACPAVVRTANDAFEHVRLYGLEELQLVGDSSCAAVVGRFPGLTALDLTSTTVTPTGLALVSSECQQLAALTIGDCERWGFSDAQFAAVVHAFPSVPIQQLRLAYSPAGASDDGYYASDGRGDLYMSAVTAVHGSTLTLADLVALDVYAFAHNLTDGGYGDLILRCPRLITAVDDIWRLLDGISRYNGIAFKDGYSVLGDGCAAAIAARFPDLEALDLEGCCLMTDAGLRSIAAGCKQLLHVNVQELNCSDRGLSLLLRACRRLDPAHLICDSNVKGRGFARAVDAWQVHG